jgi:hypothetical protein
MSDLLLEFQDFLVSSGKRPHKAEYFRSGRVLISDIPGFPAGDAERIPTSRNPNQNSATFWWIFHQINVLQPIGRKDSIQTVILTSRRLDSILYEAAHQK